MKKRRDADMDRYGELLREARELRGLSQVEAAYRAGLNQSGYSLMERGGRSNLPDIWRMRAFEEALGFSMVQQLVAAGYLDEDELHTPVFLPDDPRWAVIERLRTMSDDQVTIIMQLLERFGNMESPENKVPFVPGI